MSTIKEIQKQNCGIKASEDILYIWEIRESFMEAIRMWAES